MSAQTDETMSSSGRQEDLSNPGTWLALAGKLNAELIEFQLGLLQQYSMIPFRLFDFHSVESFMKAQKDVYEEFTEECRAEAEKLAGIADGEVSETVPVPETTYEAQIIRAQEDARQIIALAQKQAARIIADAESGAAARKRDTAEAPAASESAAA